MKLYGSLASPYVARVVMGARYKGLALEVASPPGGGIRSPEYLRLNPLGKMPALEHDGRVIVESAVILEYLDDLFPDRPLLPADPHGRAVARMLARFVDLYVGPHASILLREQMSPGSQDPAAVAAAKPGLAQGLVPIEHFLVGPYAAGSALTLADCTMLPSLNLVVARIAPGAGLGDVFAPHPKLTSWWARLRNEPLATTLLADVETATREFMARMAAQKKA